MSANRSYALQPGAGAPGFDEAIKASAASTGGAITLLRSDTAGGAPWHIHSREDECFYVLSGTIRVWHGTDVSDLGPGGFVFLPRGEPHMWDTLDGEASLLIVTVPAMLETFLDEFHAARSSEDRAEVARRYGVTFLSDDFDPAGRWPGP